MRNAIYCFPRAKVLQFSMIGELGVSWFFLLVLWRRGLLCWFSGHFNMVELRPPCQGPWLSVSGFRLHYVVSFYHLKAFYTYGEGENGSTHISSPGAESLHAHYSSVIPHRKAANHSCLLGFHLSSVFTKPVIVFLSQIPDPVSSLQTMNSCGTDPCTSSQGMEVGHAGFLPFAGPLLREQSPDHTVVPSLWQHWAESQSLASLLSAGFPSPMLGNSATLMNSHSFCDTRDPETMLSHLEFCPASSPEQIYTRGILNCSRLLKVWVLCFTGYNTFW